MTHPADPNMIDLATQYFRVGQLVEAEAVCRQILQNSPREHAALRLLGIITFRMGRLDEAIGLLQQAIELDPNNAEYYDNLCVFLTTAGRFEEVETFARKAIAVDPSYSEAEFKLAGALLNQGRLSEAVEAYQRVLALDPKYVEAENDMGNALHALGRTDEAQAAYHRALEKNPRHTSAEINLGNSFQVRGQLEEAEAAYRRALAIEPNHADAQNNLGITLQAQGRLEEAVEAYRRTLVIQPRYANAANNLATALKDQGRMGEAEQACRHALAIDPTFGGAESNLGGVLKAQGRMEEAILAYRRALAISPDASQFHSNLLLAEQYRPGVTLAGLADLHAEWNERHAVPLQKTWRPPTNDRDPDRRLRLGFVSPNFGRHPCGYFLVRALEFLDSNEYETFFYSDRSEHDDLTDRIAKAAGTWREVKGVSDEALADRIRSDEIDILITLAGHSSGNRLLVLARKPAPIQMTWTGYAGTTGLTALDYIISDRFHVPEGSEEYYKEKILRLPDGYVCYDPPDYAPEIGPLPALSQGHVTFGSFNLPAKYTPPVLEAWSEILGRIPRSRLILKNRGLDDERTRSYFTQSFAEHGIISSRLDLLGHSPHAELLDHYDRIDLTLDPFPYAGGLTTCESLWMGVPVVTWPGETFAGRHSLSHLSNVGMTETIAKDFSNYVDLAVELAQDLTRLMELRAGLRERVSKSPLCDGKRFAENFMKALRVVWREWCASAANSSPN